MIANPKIKVNYYLSSKKPISIPKLVRCFISYNAERLFIADVASIEPKYWNSKTKRVRDTIDAVDKDVINEHLDNIERWITDEFKKQVRENNSYPDHLKFKADCISLINNKGILPSTKAGMPEYTDLEQYLNRFIEKCEKGVRTNDNGQPLTEGTIKIYRTLLRNIRLFRDKGYSIALCDLNLEFYENFKEFMITELKYAVNTLGKHSRTLKAVVNEAKEDGFTNAEFKGKRYKVKSEDVESIYLDENELQSIFELDLSHSPTLDRARDLFLLGANTALRFSDWLKLDPQKMHDDIIDVMPQKTKKSVAVPINEMVKSIFNKYKDSPTRLPQPMTNQEVNRYIKEVGKNAGINDMIAVANKKKGLEVVVNTPKYELISTHTARRSAASNMYNDGVPPLAIMKITGHTTETNFMKYIKQTAKEHAKKVIEIRNRKKLKVVGGAE